MPAAPTGGSPNANGKSGANTGQDGNGRKRRPCLPKLPVYVLSTDTVIMPEGVNEEETNQKKS